METDPRTKFLALYGDPVSGSGPRSRYRNFVMNLWLKVLERWVRLKETVISYVVLGVSSVLGRCLRSLVAASYMLCAGQSYEMRLKRLKEANDGDEQLLKVLAIICHSHLLTSFTFLFYSFCCD